MALRSLEVLLAAARMIDETAKPVDVLYSHLHGVLTCRECAGTGVERRMEVALDEDTDEVVTRMPAPTAGQLLGTDKTVTGLPTGESMMTFMAGYSRHGNAQSAMDASGLAMCRCRLDALEFLNAIREANRAMIVIPEQRRIR